MRKECLYLYFLYVPLDQDAVILLQQNFLFLFILTGYRVRPLLRFCRPFMIIERCLDSNQCRVLTQPAGALSTYPPISFLSHSSLYLATHPSTQPSIPLLNRPSLGLAVFLLIPHDLPLLSHRARLARPNPVRGQCFAFIFFFWSVSPWGMSLSF